MVLAIKEMQQGIRFEIEGIAEKLRREEKQNAVYVKTYMWDVSVKLCFKLVLCNRIPDKVVVDRNRGDETHPTSLR